MKDVTGMRDFGHSSAITAALATVGGLWAAYRLFHLVSLAYCHFLYQGSLGKYQERTNPAWGLVTGASDGIGKGFAEELCSRGFNVVLHGRNKTKLEALKDDIIKQWPQREIRLLVLDASAEARNSVAIDEAVQQIADLKLKVVVNNVGGSGGLKPSWLAFAQRKPEDTHMFIDLNATFPTEITRTLLPDLINNQPALIMNVGSVCSEIPSPYVSVYAGAKAYNKAWSRSLSLEMEAEGHAVEVMNILVGAVSSGSQPLDLSFFCPSSRRMAKHSLDKVGCGRDVIWGYWPHHLQFSMVSSLPRPFMDKIVLGIALEEKSKEERAVSYTHLTLPTKRIV